MQLSSLRPCILRMPADEVMNLHRDIRQSRRTSKVKPKAARKASGPHLPDPGKMSVGELDMLIKQMEEARG